MADEQDMTDFFDDPEVRAAMAAAGVVHKPGMAKELMGELAPLLAAEGIDLDNLGDIDLDTINAAMDRATEQYNLELFTPVGERRTQSLAVLRQFSEALSKGDDDLALAILTAIQPEPTDTLPAVSHVTGAGLGLLDTWFTNPALRGALEHPHIPPWNVRMRAAARAIISCAREGRAFDSIRDLILRYAGLAVLDGTALAVAASLEAVARSRGIDVGQAFDALLKEDVHSTATARPSPTYSPGRGPVPKRSSKKNHVSGHPGRRDQSRADYTAVRDFSAWLRDQETIAAPSVDQEMGMFTALLDSARQWGINPHAPSGLERLVDEICMLNEEEPLEVVFQAFATLDDYVHFRLETSPDHTGWAEAHEEVELAMDEVDPGVSILDDVIEIADQIDPEELRAAFAETRVAAMVPTLLTWIGKGRKTTQTGGVRRADIAEAAAMLGVTAVGVSKYPPYDPSAPKMYDENSPLPRTVYAFSMLDVPLLASWWMALRTAEVIRTTSSTVRPGPMAEQWLAEDLPPLELMEKLIAVFIGETLLEDLRRLGWYNEQVAALTFRRLMNALTPEDAPVKEEDDLEPMLKPRVTNKLRLLEQMGLVELDGDECTVPPVLRGVVARGLLVTAALVERTAEDE